MPRYSVKHYNAESGMLHSQHDVYAADEESAIRDADRMVAEESGFSNSADGRQVTTVPPRFRVAVSETE